MHIGIPKEVKNQEYRVGGTPSMVHALVGAGHQVMVQKDAGLAAGYPDSAYREIGATIVETALEVYQTDMVIKVKEPIESEYPLLHKDLILFCYLHLAPNRPLTEALLESGCVAIAYETVVGQDGGLPLLSPMSEIAGRIASQEGAIALQKHNGGRGVLLGGIPGVPPARVVIIGGGAAGTQAALVARGMGAQVTIIDRNLTRLKELEALYNPSIYTLFSTSDTIASALEQADLVIGSVLLPGKLTPKLVTRDMIKAMPDGAVFVDVAIDQGGCSETSRPTTHDNPTYIEEGVVHYCVTNMPGACPRTASRALTHATLDAALKLANLGWEEAFALDPCLKEGLNVCHGKVTNIAVAADLGFEYHQL